MTWSSWHKISETNASAAHAATRMGLPDEAAFHFRIAADSETKALDALPRSKSRTRGITAVSAVSLWIKAGESQIAEQLAQRCLADTTLPPFATDQLRAHLQSADTAPSTRKAQGSSFAAQVLTTVRVNSRACVSLALLTLLINGLVVVLAWLIATVFDQVAGSLSKQNVWMYAAGLGLVITSQFVLRSIRLYMLGAAAKQIQIRSSTALFDRVMDVTLEHWRQAGSTIVNAVREFERIWDQLSPTTLAALFDLPFVLLFAGAIVWLAGAPMAVPVLTAMTILICVGLAVQATLGAQRRRLSKAAAASLATVEETASAIENIKQLNAAPEFLAKWNSNNSDLRTARFWSHFSCSASTCLTALVRGGAALAVLVIGGYAVANQQLTLGALAACIMLTDQVLVPLSGMGTLLVNYHSAVEGVNAFDNVMQAPVDHQAGRTFIRRQRLQGQIDFRAVTFRYAQQKVEALRDLTVHIAARDRVGVVGRMGAGKTTFARLVAGLYEPHVGNVLLDGINGWQIEPSDRRRNIGYMSQDVKLFSGTLRQNLTMGAAEVSDDALLRAVTLVGLDEHINRHPQGFDMPVGDRGDGLSGGQKQAVALARALLLDPAILLLDEPTASMDIGTEEQFKTRLVPLLEGRTLIVVTHRESMLVLVDKLLVIDGGCAVAYGPKAEVLQALSQGRVRRATPGGSSMRRTPAGAEQRAEAEQPLRLHLVGR